MMEGCVQQLAAHTDAQTSHIIEEVTQRLEREIDAIATSVAMTAEVKSRDAMELMRRKLQAQLDQNLVESHRHK